MPELYYDPLFTSSVKAYYRFESGDLTTDSSGNSHTLTAVSDPAETTGKFNGGVALDGNDAYSIADHADFKPTGNFTVGCWVNSSTLASQRYFSSFSQNTNFAGWWIGCNSSGYVSIVSGKNTGTVAGTDYGQVIDSVDINDGSWHIIIGTWDGSKLHLYKDGTEIGTGTTWANAPVYAATNYVRFGCYSTAGTNTAFVTGSMDDIFIINGAAISAADALKLSTDLITTTNYLKQYRRSRFPGSITGI